jgi:hypothetical protein
MVINRWLLLAVCLVGLSACPVYIMWALAVDRYRAHLREHAPEFLERRMKDAPGPRGDYRSLIYLTGVPAPDVAGEPLRLRATALRRLANGLLGVSASIFALIALRDALIAC